MPQPIPVVIPICVLAVGLFLMANGWLDIRLGRETFAWPRVEGRVLSSAVRRAPFGPGRVVARVRYSYRVDGAAYESDRLTFRRFQTRQEAELAAYHFPVGSKVIVYHHPRIPDRAVLMPGVGPLPWLNVAFGVLVLGGAAFLLWGSAAV